MMVDGVDGDGDGWKVRMVTAAVDDSDSDS